MIMETMTIWWLTFLEVALLESDEIETGLPVNACFLFRVPNITSSW